MADGTKIKVVYVPTRSLYMYVNGRYIAQQRKSDTNIIYYENGKRKTDGFEIADVLKLAGDNWIVSRREKGKRINAALLYIETLRALFYFMQNHKNDLKEHGGLKEDKQGDIINSVSFTVSKEQLFLALHGITEGHKINLNPVHEYESRLIEFIAGAQDEAEKKEDGEEEKKEDPEIPSKNFIDYATLISKKGSLILFKDKPGTIEALPGEKFSVSINTDFFPVMPSDKGYSILGPYVTMIAGLPLFLRHGLYLRSRRGSKEERKARKGLKHEAVTMAQAHKVVTLVQCAFSGMAVKGVTFEISDGKKTAVIHSSVLMDIFPHDIEFQKHKEKEYIQICISRIRPKTKAITEAYYLAWNDLKLSSNKTIPYKDLIYLIPDDVYDFPREWIPDKKGKMKEQFCQNAMYLRFEL